MNPQENPPDNNLFLRRLFWLTMIIGSGIAGLIYLLMFNSMSESAMVELSFIWIALLAFGGAGIGLLNADAKRPLLGAVGAAVLVLALLEIFFITIWPSL